MKILDKILLKFIESFIVMISNRIVRRGLMSEHLMQICLDSLHNSLLPMKSPDAFVSLVRKGYISISHLGKPYSKEDIQKMLDSE